jgi:hypothetical protein
MLLGLAIVLWYQWPPAATSVPTSNLPTARPQGVQAVNLPQAVRLADLEDAPAETEVGRNPFSYGARPITQPAIQFTPPPVNLSPAPFVPQGPPPIALRLTGLMVSPGSNRTMVTLKDPVSGTLFHAFEGEVVDGRYRVVKVGQQSVVVSYVDGSGSRTVGLGN